MIIAGKNLEFIIEQEDILLPRLSTNTISELRKSKFEYLKRILQFYRNQDANGIFHELRNLVEQKFVEVLALNPEFITSDHFSIHIRYKYGGGYSLARYVSDLSSMESAHFEVYLNDSLIRRALSNGIGDLVFHEFIHHLDNKKFSMKLLTVKILELKKVESTFSVNSALIPKYFAGIREEGTALFFEELNKNRKIGFYKSYLKESLDYLEELCKDFEPSLEHVEDIVEHYRIGLELINHYKVLSIKHDKLVYRTGAMMTGIIVLHNLFKENKKFSVWIQPKGFRWFGKRDYNADQINKYYGIKDFDLFFADREVDDILITLRSHLFSLNPIKFLKEYEDGCGYFNIKNKFFDSKSYLYYKNKCKANYRNLVYGTSDYKEIKRIQS